MKGRAGTEVVVVAPAHKTEEGTADFVTAAPSIGPVCVLLNSADTRGGSADSPPSPAELEVAAAAAAAAVKG